MELTCPVSRRMLLHALNSGAKVVMADFEDSTSPTWFNLLDGQLNVRDAVRRSLQVDGVSGSGGVGGAPLRLKEKMATLMVRPRGWHLAEANVLVDGSVPAPSRPPPLSASPPQLTPRPCFCLRAVMSASLFDFGLFVFHNAQEVSQRSSSPPAAVRGC